MKTRIFKWMVLTAIVMAVALSSAALAESVADTQRLDTYYSLSINYINREDYDKAMEYLDAALGYCNESDNPDMYADIHLKKGCVYTMQGDSEKALKELDEAIRVKESLSEAWLVKTQVYSDTEKYAEAIESLEKYIEMSGDFNMYETLSQLYQQVGDSEKALEAYNKFAENVGASETEVAYRKGVYKMGAGMYAEAIEEFKPCLKDETYGASAAYNTGVCYMNSGDYENALAAFDQCVEAGGSFDGLSYNRGVCLMTTGKFPEAIEAFTASAEGESFRTDALYNRAVCQMSSGEYEAAIADFTSYIDERAAAAKAEAGDGGEPASTVDVANYYRGVCYLSTNDFQNAVNDFTACLENGVSEADSLFNRGLSYLQAGEFESAKADFSECIKNENNVDEALFYRAYANRYLGEFDAAIADFTACIDHGYNLGQSYYQRAQVYNDMKDDEHYVADLEESLKY